MLSESCRRRQLGASDATGGELTHATEALNRSIFQSLRQGVGASVWVGAEGAGWANVWVRATNRIGAERAGELVELGNGRAQASNGAGDECLGEWLGIIL